MRMLKRHLKKSIYYQLLILVSTLVLAFLLIYSFSSAYSISQYERQIYQQGQEVLSSDMRNIENELLKMSRVSSDVIINMEMQRNLLTFQESGRFTEKIESRYKVLNVFENYLAMEPYIGSISVYDEKGQEYISTIDYTVCSDENIEEMCRMTQKNKFIVHWVVFPEQENNLYLCRALSGTAEETHRLDGMLVVRLDIRQMMEEIGVSADVKLLITNGGKVLYNNILADTEANTDFIADKEYAIRKIDHEYYFITRLEKSNLNNEYTLFMPYDDALNGIRAMRYTVVATIVVEILLLLLIGFLIFKSIVHPINQLSGMMTYIENGDFRAVVREDEYADSKNEIHILHNNVCNMAEKIDKLVFENYYKQLLLKDTQLQMLNLHINPHFLYNTLTSIYFMAQEEGQMQTADMVKALSDLFRETMNTKEWLIPLKEELKLLGQYIFIQTKRYADRLAVHIDIPEEYMECMVPKMIFQPLVENSITYVAEKELRLCEVYIEVQDAGEDLIFSVSDNGDSVPADFITQWKSGRIQPKGHGIGLENIDRRVRAVYGDEYGIQLSRTAENGLRIEIRIKKQAEEEGK